MSKTEWGVKRICPSCGTKYYDFEKKPIICPKCNFEFDPDLLLKSKKGRGFLNKTEESNANAVIPSEDSARIDGTITDDVSDSDGLEIEDEIEDQEILDIEDEIENQIDSNSDLEIEGEIKNNNIEVEETEEMPFIEDELEDENEVSVEVEDEEKDNS